MNSRPVSAPARGSQNDFMSRTSALVAEGVATLSNWENEVTSIRKLERAERDRKRAAARAHAQRKADASRAALLENMKKFSISTSHVDPMDFKASKVVVQEFEKYIFKKQSEILNQQLEAQDHQGQKKPLAQAEALSKVVAENRRGVQFNALRKAAPSPTGQENKKHQIQNKTSDRNYLEGSYRLEIPQDKKSFASTGTTPANSKSTPSRRRSQFGTQLPILGTPEGMKDNADWWRRKIRQGIVQTEMLMTELIRQRRQDEQYFQTTNPYFHALEAYEARRPYSSRSARGSASISVRDRLRASLAASRQLHQETFGLGSLSLATAHARGQSPASAPASARSAATTESDLFSEDDDEEALTSAAEMLQTKKQIQIQTSRKLQANAGAKKSKQSQTPPPTAHPQNVQTAPPPADVHVLYERSSNSNEIAAASVTPFLRRDKVRDKVEQKNIPSPRIVPGVKEQIKLDMRREQFQNKIDALMAQKVEREQKKVTEKKEPTKKEWVARLAEAKKLHQEKAEAVARAKLESRRAHKHALYNELMSNKTRLEGEVSLEKRKMALNWKLEHPHRESQDPRPRSRSRSRSTGALSSRPKSRSRSAERKNRYSYSHYGSVKQNDREPFKTEFPRWKETPVGLNLWLENVVAKANKEKEVKESARQNLNSHHTHS